MVIHGVEYTRSEVFTVCLTMKRLPMWMVKTAACLLLRAHDTRCLQLRKHGFPPSKKKKKNRILRESCDSGPLGEHVNTPFTIV